MQLLHHSLRKAKAPDLGTLHHHPRVRSSSVSSRGEPRSPRRREGCLHSREKDSLFPAGASAKAMIFSTSKPFPTRALTVSACGFKMCIFVCDADRHQRVSLVSGNPSGVNAILQMAGGNYSGSPLPHSLNLARLKYSACPRRAQRRLTASVTPLSAAAPRIQLVCVDIDGTLLNSRSELSDATEAAVAACSAAGVPVSAPDLPHNYRVFSCLASRIPC